MTDETADLCLYDVLSKTVMHMTIPLNADSDEIFKLNITSLGKGLYTIVVKTSEKSYSARFIRN